MNNSGDYNRIAAAIDFLSANAKRQPSLDELAAHVHLSPFHFQRMFTEWAGVSPKKFLQYLTVEYAKQLLSGKKDASLFDTADEAGLSGTGRLHDLFVNIEGMTPGEFRDGGKNLEIAYSFNSCVFGTYLVASTPKGICDLHFFDGNQTEAFENLKQLWYNATLTEAVQPVHDQISCFFNNQESQAQKISLHLRGTSFQLKVWQALLKIPEGTLANYGGIAAAIGQQSASRAVGSAIGCNRVAYLIPCHRVIRNSAVAGDFRWGTSRKKAMIGWEAAHLARESTV